jgi:3-oxoacyl-[acyl-carrier-protein] synthase II
MSSLEKRRVVITGLGALTNVGSNVPDMWRALIEGRSGIRTIESFPQDDEWSVRIAGEIDDDTWESVVDRREAKRMDRCSLFGLAAAEEAVRDCGFDFTAGDKYRQGVVVGSGIGGIITIEEGHKRLLKHGPRKMSPFTVPKLMVNACAGNISIRHNLCGANSATATACATGGHAIGTAAHLIQRGDADIMVAGGSEAAITPLTIASFASMKALSSRNDDPQRASRPFDRDRDGFVLAEGAAVLVIESLEHAQARGARIYAEIFGFGSSGDGQHIAAPDEEGRGAVAAMAAALKDAQITPEQVGYINAHGTATPLGDIAEVKAVRQLFGDHATKVAVSSTKSMIGHALGAAGGVESVIVVKAVEQGVLPPTVNLDHPDEGNEDMNFVANEAQERKLDFALNNTFGFGGHNVSLVFGRAPV